MGENSSGSTAAGLADISLADRFDLTKSPVLLNGAQAVARLLLAQKARDRRAGLNTAGFVSRLSRLAGRRARPAVHQARQALFEANDIHFEPGLNEELAATAVWGAQQAEMRGEGRFDGVFSLWYGKGPGVDRCGDVFRHANLAGTSPPWRRARADGRRPYRRILDHRASIRVRLRRRDDAGPLAGRRAGDPRLRRARLGPEPLRRRLGRPQMRQGHDRIDGRRRQPRSIACRPSRPPISPCRPAASTSARPTASSTQEARLQEHKRAAVVAWIAANKLNRIIASGGAEAADRHHHRRQVLSRHAPGARRSRHRRSPLQRARPAPLQARLRLADRAGAACANSRAGSTSSSSSRRSAR